MYGKNYSQKNVGGAQIGELANQDLTLLSSSLKLLNLDSLDDNC